MLNSTSGFVAFALAFVAIGAVIWSLMFAVNWWLATRRAGQADRFSGGRRRSPRGRFAAEFNSWWPDEPSAAAAADRFRPGEPVTVWYEPDSPATVVLNKTPPTQRTRYRRFTLVAGLVAVVAALSAITVIARLP